MNRLYSILPLLLLAPDAAAGAATPDSAARIAELEKQVQDLRAENTALQDENEGLRGIVSENKLPDDIEKLVRQKTAVGLTRAQALEVVRAQALWDEQQKKTAKAK